MEGECLETHNIYKNIVAEMDDIDIVVTDPANILASQDIKDDETENSGILIEDYVSCDKIAESKTSTSYCQPLLPLQSVKLETCSVEGIAQKINQVKEFSNNGSDEMSHINYLQKVAFDSLDEGVPDENDIYNRFYFESDHLALKDNAE